MDAKSGFEGPGSSSSEDDLSCQDDEDLLVTTPTKPRLSSQIWLLAPFLLLHMTAGMTGGFTTVLVQFLQNSQQKMDSNTTFQAMHVNSSSEYSANYRSAEYSANNRNLEDLSNNKSLEYSVNNSLNPLECNNTSEQFGNNSFLQPSKCNSSLVPYENDNTFEPSENSNSSEESIEYEDTSEYPTPNTNLNSTAKESLHDKVGLMTQSEIILSNSSIHSKVGLMTQSEFMFFNMTDTDKACVSKQSSILLVTAEDYAPIVIAILSGFLQQWVGPKRILQVTAIPFFVSFALVVAAPDKTWMIILSRFVCGIATGLLSSNVYAADMSHKDHRQSIKMIESASRSIGFIIIYTLNFIFWNDGPRYIASIASVIPVLSFIGLWFKPESTSFTAESFIRLSQENKSIATENAPHNLEKKPVQKSKMSNMELPPFRSKAIYKPLLFITGITCLKQFSGVTFTKKFLLQILAPKTDDGDRRLPTLFAIGITTIRLFANLYMAKLVKKTRIRFLFFFSLFTTAVCLIILGLFLEENLFPGISETVIKYIRVGLLALHIFLVQFGLQGISTNMTDLLFPTKYKSVMKGFTGAIFYISLVIVTSALTITVDCKIQYSWTFWIMGSVLILASPFLFVFVPEVRNIGRTMAGEFYVKAQTVFHIILQRKDNNRKSRIFSILQSPLEPQRSFKNTVKQVMVMQSLQLTNAQKRKTMLKIDELNKALSMIGSDQDRLSRYISREEEIFNTAKEAPAVIFDTEFEQMKDLQNSEINEERVAFVNCIHSQRGFLENNKNKTRVLIGNGPVMFEKNFLLRKGGIFLFNDIVLVSHCIRANLRYVNETVFQIDDDNFVIKVDETQMTLSNEEITLNVTVDEESTAKTWKKYIKFVKKCKM